jgi:glycopeptide antibiotics resistance protein
MIKLFAAIRNFWLAITIFTFAVITILSLYPLQDLPDFPGNDKTHHFIAYGSLMFPVALRKPNHWMFIGLFFVLWSGGIELVQPYVNRYGDWFDLAANTLGIFFGFLSAQVINYFLPSEKK